MYDFLFCFEYIYDMMKRLGFLVLVWFFFRLILYAFCLFVCLFLFFGFVRMCQKSGKKVTMDFLIFKISQIPALLQYVTKAVKHTI